MHSFYGTRLSENMAKTPEGYLICYDVNIARIGTQEYLGSELGVEDEVVVVNRPPEEVFKPATVASFEGKPFTNNHPFELLDISNTAIYEKGHVQNVRISDDKTYIIADIMVKDAQTISDIENGKRELSAGYNCDCLQDEDGNWYQCNIIGNHVALVDKGRAGEKVRINDNDFKEQDHPRDKDGKFASGGGSSSSSKNEKASSKTNAIKKHLNEIYEEPFITNSQAKEIEKATGLDYDMITDIIDASRPKNSDDFDVDKATKNIEKMSNLKEFIVQHYEDAFLTKSEANELKEKTGFSSDEVQNVIASVTPKGSDDYDPNDVIKKFIEKHKEKKTMKDTKTVLGKLLKAFAKDAEPEEMVEAVKAVQGEDEEPAGGDDRVAKLEAQVAELTAKLEKLYTAEKQEEKGEMHALDELEKEITDENPDDEGNKEVKDEDAENDPKLIEAISEKAQADEDTTEEIKKEIADAKKVIAKIEDKETRLAVADSLAKVIRGKMKSANNYKKLMDASKRKPVADSKTIDYNAVFKKIKEEKFRK